MQLIATHNSATGEKPRNLISYLVLPFARTQSKTIKEQYECGCRMFDIRARKSGKEWVCAHGLFTTKRTLMDILLEINSFEENCYVCLTYEGKLNNTIERQEFLDMVDLCKHKTPNIFWGGIAVKYLNDGVNVGWGTIQGAEKFAPNHQGFIPLNGHTWQTYLPIPWLWNFIYTRKHEFNENDFTFVDFL